MEIKMRGLLQEVSGLFFVLPLLLLRSTHHPSPYPRMVSVPISRFVFRNAPANSTRHVLAGANHDEDPTYQN